MTGLAEAIQTCSKQCEAMKEQLIAVKEKYERVKALGGQHGYSIAIDGLTIQVAGMDHETYGTKLLRGKDMIHLGALKVLDAEIDRRRGMLKAKCDELAGLAAQMAEAAGRMT